MHSTATTKNSAKSSAKNSDKNFFYFHPGLLPNAGAADRPETADAHRPPHPQTAAYLRQELDTLRTAYAELQTRHAVLQQIFDTANASIFVKEYRHTRGTYILANRMFAEWTNLEAHDFQVTDYDLFSEPVAAAYRQADLQALITQMPTQVEEREPHQEGWRTSIVSKFPLFDKTGQAYAIAGIAFDISELKRIEANLRQREAKLEAKLNEIHDFVPGVIYQYKVDRATGELVFTYLSHRCHELFAITASDCLANPGAIRRLIHPDDRDQINAALANADRPSWFDEFRIILPSGQEKWIRGLSSRSELSAATVVHNGIFMDVSDRKQAELAVQASEARLRQQNQDLEETLIHLQKTQLQLIQSEKMSSLGRLVAGIAHEINNPVNFIHGNVDHLQAYVQDLLKILDLYRQSQPLPSATLQAEADEIDLDFIMQDLPKVLDSMKVGTERIREIVLSLRTFSRLDEAEYKTVDLHAGLDSTLLILQNRLKVHGPRHEIRVIKDYGPLPGVECYAGPLNQVFMNLLNNAIDALEEHWDLENSVAAPPTIRIQTQQLDQTVEIRISDNGAGIPETILSQIFDPFFTTKPVGKGTGMGLSICYQIITEKHFGTLRCLSQPNPSQPHQGTEFIMQIPLQQSQPVKQTENPAV